MIEAAPKQGKGLHDWILTTSRDLLMQGNYGVEDVIEQMTTATADSRRTSQNLETEIRNAVEGAAAFLLEHPESFISPSNTQRKLFRNVEDYLTNDPFKWVDRRSYWLPSNERVRKLALAANFELTSSGYFSYEALFCQIDFLICCAIDVWNPQIYRVRKWIPLIERQQFIVSTYCLTKKRGKCDDNMGKSLYQVIEFDGDSKENQLRLLARLDQEIRLGMIVDSGNKSLHGWFPVFHLGRKEVKSFFRLATSLGADRHLWVASQYVRAPLGLNRKTGCKQEVVYWNEDVIGEHSEIVRSLCQ